MSAREKLSELTKMRKDHELGGGHDAIEKVHASGKLTARERIESFVDPRSFKEFNLWAEPTRTGFEIDKRNNFGDAVVTGFAKVGGRPVCVYAHDFTIMAGTQAPVQHWKICKVIETAVKLGIPYVGIIDSAGVRIYDAFGANSGAGMGRNADVWYLPSLASGVVPSISLTLGASYAGTAYSPFLADVFFMVNKPYCYMSLASPELLKSVTFKDVTREEIGSPLLHAEVTGSCDYLGETEEEVLRKGRELLSFLPSNCREKPPIVDTDDDPNRVENGLIDVVSGDGTERYDMHKIITLIVDDGEFLELKSRYAKNIITGFARLGGRSVGIVANNPLHNDGALDLGAVEKEARFIRYCDAYNVPLVFLVDTPGFIVDAEEEYKGFARHAAMVSYAICESTVPKITVYIGRCYNNGHLATGTRLMGVDAVLAWPNADIQRVDLKQTIVDVFGKRAESLESASIEKFAKKYFESPRRPAALLMVDDIIEPGSTRPNLTYLLETMSRKDVKKPDKKHGNMPL